MSTIDWGQESTPQDVVVDGIATDPPGDIPSRGVEDQDEAPAPAMGLKNRNLRFVLRKALMDFLKADLDADRTDHTFDLVKRYEDDGVKSMDVKLPDGSKIAAISLSVPSKSTEVVDDEALVKWACENAGWLLKDHIIPAVPEQVIPAQAERTEKVLDTEALTEFLKAVKPVEASGGPVVDPDTGSIVDGIVYTPEGKPRSFSVRYTTDGREEVVRAWRTGLLEHLTAGSVLPVIDGTDQ